MTNLRGFLTTTDFAVAGSATVRPDVWDFIEGGAGHAEATLRGNTAAFESVRLLPSALVGVEHVDTSTSLFDRTIAAPLLVAPTALHTMVHPGGESATAAAATGLGVPMVMSTFAGQPIEQVSEHATSKEMLWSQLYVFRDRALTKDLIARAELAGVGALVVTVDSPWLGRRHRDMRRNYALPPGVTTGHLAQSLPAALKISSPQAHSKDAMDPGLTWDDVAEVAAHTDLPVLAKGVLAADDARRAAEAGLAGIIVSNHGGRQLDRVVPTLHALPDVVAAAGDLPVLMDGGVRTGADIVIALALGARAVLVGRPVLWGLATAGQAGVHAVLSLLMEEMVDVMGHLGRPHVEALDPSLLAPAAGPPAGQAA